VACLLIFKHYCVILACKPVAEIIENYQRDHKQQHQCQQQVSAGAMLPPDVFVRLQFGDDSRVCFISLLIDHFLALQDHVIKFK